MSGQCRSSRGRSLAGTRAAQSTQSPGARAQLSAAKSTPRGFGAGSMLPATIRCWCWRDRSGLSHLLQENTTEKRLGKHALSSNVREKRNPISGAFGQSHEARVRAPPGGRLLLLPTTGPGCPEPAALPRTRLRDSRGRGGRGARASLELARDGGSVAGGRGWRLHQEAPPKSTLRGPPLLAPPGDRARLGGGPTAGPGPPFVCGSSFISVSSSMSAISVWVLAAEEEMSEAGKGHRERAAQQPCPHPSTGPPGRGRVPTAHFAKRTRAVRNARSRHGTARLPSAAQINSACFCKGPGASQGGFLQPAAGTPVIAPTPPLNALSTPPTIVENNNNKTGLGSQELCHGC